MSTDRLISIVRSERGLQALFSKRERGEKAVRFAFETRGFDAMSPAVSAKGRQVQTSWSTLAQSRRPTLDALCHATVVLLETMAEPGAPCRIRTGLRSALHASAGDIARRLLRMGYEPARVAAALQSRDPYLEYHHGPAADAGAVPPRFGLYLLPLLRGLPWRVVRQTLASFWASRLDEDGDLRAAVARLLALAGPERALAWWRLLLRLAPEQRLSFAVSLIETEACATDPAPLTLEDVDRVAALATGDLAADRLALVADGLARRRPMRFILTYLRTAQAYAPDCGVSRLSAFAHDAVALRELPPDFDQTLHLILDHVAAPMQQSWGSGFALGLCRACALLPGLAALLGRPVFLESPPATSFALLRFLLRGFYYEEAPDLEQWAHVRRELPALEAHLAQVPVSHQPKYVSLFEEVLFRWSDAEERAARRSSVHALVRRVARPPLLGHDGAAECLAALIDAARENPQRLLSLPDASFRRLEEACRIDNRRRLLVPGLATLAARMPGLVLEALAQHPEALLKAATTLGSASQPRRAAILRRFRSHPILQRRFLKRPIAEIAGLLSAWSGSGRTNPIPRKLRLHLEAGAALSEASVERHRQTIARRLVLVKLDLLRDAVMRDLAAGLPAGLAEGDGGRHALVMLGSLDRNRRLLRRLLAACGRGDRDFALHHVANRAWLARHPKVDAARWILGLTDERAVVGQGRVRFEIERDPLEVLKLGTYVGSCLSIGGLCDYAAVAVAADVNKQVVYARRRDGTVVGRQIVALTEDDRVLFFPVYPLRSSEAMEEAFLDYDLRLARCLGLAPVTDDEYEIAPIVARDWWDDGPWPRVAATVLVDDDATRS